MNSGRGEVMSLELAMQRELAYRKKVDILLLQLHSGISRGNMVSSSGPHLSGGKRKAPNGSFDSQQQLNGSSHAPRTRTNDLFCKVCQVLCSGPNSLKQHLQGQKHRSRLQNSTSITNIGVEGAKRKAPNSSLDGQQQFNGSSHAPGTRTDDLFCKVCEVPCSGPYSLSTYKDKSTVLDYKIRLQLQTLGKRERKNAYDADCVKFGAWIKVQLKST